MTCQVPAELDLHHLCVFKSINTCFEQVQLCADEGCPSQASPAWERCFRSCIWVPSSILFTIWMADCKHTTHNRLTIGPCSNSTASTQAQTVTTPCHWPRPCPDCASAWKEGGAGAGGGVGACEAATLGPCAAGKPFCSPQVPAPPGAWTPQLQGPQSCVPGRCPEPEVAPLAAACNKMRLSSVAAIQWQTTVPQWVE